MDYFEMSISEAMRRAAHAFTVRPNAKRGDTVRLNVTAYVQAVNNDGTLSLSSTADPFAEPIVLDRCHRSRIVITKKAPPEPRVGDTITGETLRATPWRRGTIIRVTEPDSREHVGYILGADGKWTNINTGKRVPFEDIRDALTFVVDRAPGKQDPSAADFKWAPNPVANVFF